MTISAWFAVVLAIPVLLLGEQIVRRVPLLGRFNLPAPVVGGLLLSLVLLAGNLTGLFAAKFATSVTAQWWTWLVTTEPEWVKAPAKGVNLPFLVAFFTCIGLNASWSLVKKGSVQVLLFLAIAGVLAVLQNFIGVGMAKLLGVLAVAGIGLRQREHDRRARHGVGFRGRVGEGGIAGRARVGRGGGDVRIGGGRTARWPGGRGVDSPAPLESVGIGDNASRGEPDERFRNSPGPACVGGLWKIIPRASLLVARS